MIPKINPDSSVDPVYLNYFSRLKSENFQGDIEYSYSSRLAVATDNSVYQRLPKGVIFPKNRDDVALAVKIAGEPEFAGIRFAPRGGGTGTNGQSLTDWLVMDMSRHMRGIRDLNVEGRTVFVESGVIKDYLNQQIKPHGLFFSPELSTSNRATFGGMISNDSSGQGSLKYGKTSQHVLTVEAVLLDGSAVTFGPVSGDALKAKMDQENMEGRIYRTVYGIAKNKREEILKTFPDLNRFLTGYDLKHVYDPETDTIDISRIICGAEGTLCFITGATVDLTPIPSYRSLVVIKYDSFDSALRHAPVLVEANALSVETVDSKVFNLAKQDIVWHSVKDLICEVPGRTMDGINIVEFAGWDNELEGGRMKALTDSLDKDLGASGNTRGIIGYQTCTELKDILAVYAMRKKAVGLLGNAEGDAKPIAFTEDTVVPPKHLADYIQEFRALLDSHNLTYGMFGHVDSGVLHVRPALDLCDPEQEKTLRTISDSVVALTAKYGGIMWGEHGRGFRSEYGPEFFGGLFEELRKVKAAFDPNNRINPGKICVPYGIDNEKLVSVDDTKRGFYDRQIPVDVRHSFRAAVSCNGNGLCFNFDKTAPMCPTYKLLGDRRQSPKGRAGLTREWLRLLQLAGTDILKEEQDLNESGFSLGVLFAKLRNTMSAADRNDFSHEVRNVMDCCLACKACASACPVKVDVPDFRSRFLNLYFSRYLRPAGDLLVRNIEQTAPYMAKMPRLMNAVNGFAPVKFITKKLWGFVDVPVMSYPTFSTLVKSTDAEYLDLDQMSGISEQERCNCVILVQDAFTSAYDAPVIADFISLASKMGKKVLILPLKPNGKVMHIRGYMKAFAKTARSTADFYNKVYQLGIPMVGVDPAMTLCYRDEYRKILGDSRGDFVVQMTQEWLLDNLDALKKAEGADGIHEYYLMAHCTQKSLKPTTHADWTRIFGAAGLKLVPVPVGCCGMAGLYGHLKANVERSMQIYRENWAPVFRKYPLEYCLATGYSCREQVRRMEGKSVMHPLQVLNMYLK